MKWWWFRLFFYREHVLFKSFLLSKLPKYFGSHGRGKHDKEMEWENEDHLKLEHRYNLKWNFFLDLATVHCFCLCTVYVKLELNKPIHDMIYLPNGSNILLSLPQKLVISVAPCRWSFLFLETEPLYTSLPTFSVI